MNLYEVKARVEGSIYKEGDKIDAFNCSPYRLDYPTKHVVAEDIPAAEAIAVKSIIENPEVESVAVKSVTLIYSDVIGDREWNSTNR